MPRLSLPSVIGIVSEEPKKQAFTCAGWIEKEKVNLANRYLHRLNSRQVKCVLFLTIKNLPLHSLGVEISGFFFSVDGIQKEIYPNTF